jgi:hypothetical protein
MREINQRKIYLGLETIPTLHESYKVGLQYFLDNILFLSFKLLV